jgi:DNA-binding NarL/FixJ family response regulator
MVKQSAEDSPLSPPTILVASDVRLFREALAESLSRQSDWTLVGTADSCQQLVGLLETHPADIVVFDAALSGALKLVRRCAGTRPELKFVAVAVTESENEIIACAEAGVAAYLPREGSVDELIVAVRRVRRGELLCSPQVAGSLFRRIAAMSAARADDQAFLAASLTRRELEIVALLDRGFSNKQIAVALNIEVPTVKNHIHRVLEKLQVKRRGEAAARLRATPATGRI